MTEIYLLVRAPYDSHPNLLEQSAHIVLSFRDSNALIDSVNGAHSFQASA